jgi:hypothetical protein
MITCQHEWIDQCQIKYRYEPLPDGEHWEDAHYPVPECQGGTETVKLWSRDHAVHGFLQSEDLDQVCFHGYRRKSDRILIEKYYPEYLELCDQWFIEAQRRAFQAKLKQNPNCQSEAAKKIPSVSRSKGGKVSGRHNVLLGRGFLSDEYLSSEKWIEDKKKSGKKCVEMQAGMHNPDYKFSEKRIEDCKRGGKAGGTKVAELQVGILSPEYLTSEERIENCQKGGRITMAAINSQKWIDPDHPELGEHSAPTLVKMQKKRGYPHGKENRRRVG